MTGAMSVVATEFCAPGVPLVVALAFQFCPRLLSKSTLISSSDLPKPSAGDRHRHPRCPKLGSSRSRTDQSPSSAYCTSSTFVPTASLRITLFEELESFPVHPAMKLVTVGYFAVNFAAFAATTRYPPGRILLPPGKVNAIPFVNCQPLRSTALAPEL